MNRVMKNQLQFLREKINIDQNLFIFQLNFRLLEFLLLKIKKLTTKLC
jgi:hypothetical protein